MLDFHQFHRKESGKEALEMFRTEIRTAGGWCCRMQVSRACSMAGAFGCLAARLRRIR